MKITLFLLPFTLAYRSKRSIAVDIDSIQDAFYHYVTNSTFADTHGCHCVGLGDSTISKGGQGVDELDRLCLKWKNARQCLDLQLGACESEASDYTVADTTICDDLTNTCQRKTCQVDAYFSTAINDILSPSFAFNTNPTCSSSNYAPDYDACCGISPETYQRFVSSEMTCSSNVVTEIVQTCVEGQQIGLSGTCEDCPEGTFSSANSSCEPCNSVADILIVLDGSGSMTNGGKWNLQRNAVKDFVSNFDVASDKVKFRIVQYNKNVQGTSGNKGVSWGTGSSATNLNNALNNLIQGDKQSCDTCSQVHEAYGGNNGFSTQFSNVGRNAAKFVLVFADGINGDEKRSVAKTDLQTGRDWAANNGAEIFFVRIGQSNSLSYGGSALDRTHFVNDINNWMTTGSDGWDALDNIIPIITNKVCSS